jgi:hypothetical protein
MSAQREKVFDFSGQEKVSTISSQRPFIGGKYRKIKVSSWQKSPLKASGDACAPVFLFGFVFHGIYFSMIIS